MKKIDLALALCGGLAACNVNALTIDSFETLQVNTRVTAGSGVVTTNTAAPPLTYIGTSRNLASQSTGTDTGTDFTDVSITPSALRMVNGGNSAGTIYVQWNNISGSASDFTEGGNSLGLRISLPAPLPNAMSVTFLVNGLSSAPSSAQYTYPSGTAGNAIPYFAFASFTDPSVFTNVTTLRMTVTGATGWDGAIDGVETVPLPGTLMLVGIGLAGLARSIKRA